MSVKAIFGKLYTGSITGAGLTTGTLIANVLDPIIFRIGTDMWHFKSGRVVDMRKSFARGVKGVLELKLRDVSDDAKALLLSNFASGSGARSSGGSAKRMLQAAATHALIVRADASDEVIYMPNAVLDEESPDIAVHRSRDESVFDEQEVHFSADKASGNTEPAWDWGTVAELNSAYAALS